MLLFRSADVAHGTARAKQVPTVDASSAPTFDQVRKRWTSNRLSFDMRCRCTPHPSALGLTTERGELCMSVWRDPRQNTEKTSSHAPFQFGCQQKGGERPWCVVHPRKTATKDAINQTGAGCLLKHDGSLCEWPCAGASKRCSELYFDYCTDQSVFRSV